MLLPVGLAVLLGALVGVIGYSGFLDWAEPDLQIMQETGVLRGQPFMAAWGVHLGGYIGGFAGGIAAIACIVRWRKRNQSAATEPAQIDLPGG